MEMALRVGSYLRPSDCRHGGNRSCPMCELLGNSLDVNMLGVESHHFELVVNFEWRRVAVGVSSAAGQSQWRIAVRSPS